MELDEEVGEVRSLVGKEDSVVFLLGVLNLGAVFLYSVYNQITRSQRYLGAPNSFLSDEYIERKVQSILDELVLHVQTSTYYQNVINRDSSNRVVKANVPKYASSEYVDDNNFLRRNGLTSKQPKKVTDPGRRRFAIVRRKKSRRTDRALKNERQPQSTLLKSIFSSLTQASPNPSPKPVVLKHYYQPLATADRFDTNVEEMKFLDNVKKVDKSTIRVAEVRNAQFTDGSKTQKQQTRKPAEPKNSLAETQTRPYDDLLLTTQPNHVGIVRRLSEVVNLAAPLATNIFEVFGNEQRSPKCFEKTICQVNQNWKRRGVVAGTLSPLLSIVMSWTTRNQGSPPLADTLTAIRSGWVGQPCSLLYSYCDEGETDHYEHPQKPAPLPMYSAEVNRKVPPFGPQRVPQGAPLRNPIPQAPEAPPAVAQLTSRLDNSEEIYMYRSAEEDDDDGSVSYTSGSQEYQQSQPSREEENSIYAYQSRYEKLKKEMLAQGLQDQTERNPQSVKKAELQASDSAPAPRKPETTTTTTTTPSTTTTVTTTTTTTTTPLPPGRPRSNLDSSAQVDNPSTFQKDSDQINEKEPIERSDFSTVAGVKLQDQYVRGSLLHNTEEASAVWKPESSSFFDVSEAKPGIFYSIDRWSKRARNSKVLRMPFLH